MLLTEKTYSQEELNAIQNFFDEFDTNDIKAIASELEAPKSNAYLYITSLASNCYSKSVQDIANTKIGNKITRKKNLQQVMRESFFNGANRFGNNFIA